MRVAIVTGASAGLGVEFVRQLAAMPDVDALWLVARRKERMEELAQALASQRPARVFGADMTDPAQMQSLYDALESERPQVTWLVNNAGFGKIGPLERIEVETHLNMIDLNVRALTELTQRVLPYCGRGSHILQVASIAGFMPLSNFAVYGATKAYVVSFSNALWAELGPRGIHVTAVCPGPVRTEFLELASSHGSKMDTPDAIMAEPGDVVRLAIKDARRGRMISTYGAPIRLLGLVTRFVPRSLILWASARTYR